MTFLQPPPIGTGTITDINALHLQQPWVTVTVYRQHMSFLILHAAAYMRDWFSSTYTMFLWTLDGVRVILPKILHKHTNLASDFFKLATYLTMVYQKVAYSKGLHSYTHVNRTNWRSTQSAISSAPWESEIYHLLWWTLWGTWMIGTASLGVIHDEPYILQVL